MPQCPGSGAGLLHRALAAPPEDAVQCLQSVPSGRESFGIERMAQGPRLDITITLSASHQSKRSKTWLKRRSTWGWASLHSV